jgi:hypothetical protein
MNEPCIYLRGKLPKWTRLSGVIAERWYQTNSNCEISGQSIHDNARNQEAR